LNDEAEVARPAEVRAMLGDDVKGAKVAVYSLKLALRCFARLIIRRHGR
jgi:hypothetical protein